MEVRLDLNDVLVAEATKLANEMSQTLTQLVEDLLRMALIQQQTQGRREQITLHVSSCGGGLQPDVDLSCNAALVDLLDEWDGLRDRWLKPTKREGP